MLFVKNSNLEWLKDDHHDMYAGVHSELPNNQAADVMFAKIDPGHCLPKHWHTRPLDFDNENNGYESFFFYEGGKLILLKSNENITYDLDEPFTLTFFSGKDEMHGIMNIGDKPLVFQVICAPRFVDGEEHMSKE